MGPGRATLMSMILFASAIAVLSSVLMVRMAVRSRAPHGDDLGSVSAEWLLEHHGHRT